MRISRQAATVESGTTQRRHPDLGLMGVLGNHVASAVGVREPGTGAEFRHQGMDVRCDQPSAGAEDAGKLGDRLVEVRDVAEGEAGEHAVERRLCERQGADIGPDEGRLAGRRSRAHPSMPSLASTPTTSQPREERNAV